MEELKRGRNPIRIEHDAKMIGYLSEKVIKARPYFVTADRSVVAAYGESSYAQVVENIIFPHQAFAIAQMEGKSKGVVRGLARTVFGMGRNAVQEMKEFYIDRVLDQYEPALIQGIPATVEEIVSQTKNLTMGNTFATVGDDLEVDKRRLLSELM